MSARAAAGSGSSTPRSTRCRCHAIMRAVCAVREGGAEAPHPEVMIPLIDYERELEILRELVVRVGDE